MKRCCDVGPVQVLSGNESERGGQPGRRGRRPHSSFDARSSPGVRRRRLQAGLLQRHRVALRRARLSTDAHQRPQCALHGPSRALRLCRHTPPCEHFLSAVKPSADVKQEAFEKCWAHSPLRAAALPFTTCRYCRTPPLSHAACASMSTTTTTTRDRGDRYGPIEWAK